MLINEIFKSIDGEGIRTGYPVTFIRSYGCNLLCSYCFGVNENGVYPYLYIRNEEDNITKLPLNEAKVGMKILAADSFMPDIDCPLWTTITNIGTRQIDCYYRIVIGGKSYCVSPEHEFFVSEFNGVNSFRITQKQAKDLKINDTIVNYSVQDIAYSLDFAHILVGVNDCREEQLCQTEATKTMLNMNYNGIFDHDSIVESVQYIEKPLQVYNISTEDGTYTIDGMLVHNCDTLYAVDPQTEEDKENAFVTMTPDEILSKCKEFGLTKITFTGGEPLIQKDAPELVALLLDNGYEVNIETNGAVDLKEFNDKLVDVLANDETLNNLIYTLDYKCPSSGMEDKMILDNIDYLNDIDVLKFVVGTQEDLDKMKQIVEQYTPECNIFVSPVFGQIEPKDIVQYILDNNLRNVRVQLQLHKIIYPVDMRGV